jgi:hypothetical protein
LQGILKDSWLITHRFIEMLSKLFTILETPLSRWLIKNVHVYSIELNRSIGTPNNSSNWICKINIMFFTSSTRMQNPSWRLMVSMLQFVISDSHQGLLLRQVHELANWFNFWHFRVRQWGGFMVNVSISPTNFLSFSLLLIWNFCFI